MSKAYTIGRIIKSGVGYLSGHEINLPSFIGGTLDESDIGIVNKLLKRPQDWEDESGIKRYESRFCEINGSRFAYSFIAGRVALSACLKAAGLTKGDKVIMPAYTCVVVYNALIFEGLQPVFCDIELDTYGLDISFLKKKFQENTDTKALIIQHLYGLVSRDYMELIAFARQHGLMIIEDCAHSFGAEFQGKKVGNYGDFAFYSSEQSKMYSTFTGGMAVTNSEVMAVYLERIQANCPFPSSALIKNMLITLKTAYFSHKHKYKKVFGPLQKRWNRKRMVSTVSKEEMKSVLPMGYWRRLPVPLAILGLNQLGKVSFYNQKRRANAKIWDSWCDRRQYKKPLIVDGAIPVFLRYPVLVDSKMKKDKNWSLELGVNIGEWFVSQLHPSGHYIEGCPNSEKAVRSCINFPTLLD